MVKYVLKTVGFVLYIAIILVAIHFSIRSQIFLKETFPDSMIISLSKPMLPLFLIGFLIGLFPLIFKSNHASFFKLRKIKTSILLSVTLSCSLIFFLMAEFSTLYTFSILIGIVSYLFWGVLGIRLSHMLVNKRGELN
ncbi:hypothetical protein [Paenibacillus pabuli]|uniref:hypothetical protein n=1 Tax=Paenibacillus pabuli TaxID=1472 RepID=UPI001FFFE92A|nr:hypothetical protein [Paenibacillus pabuli]UPK44828.1 hypothetical protein KET34_04750 [Paenibacillus pabuli]